MTNEPRWTRVHKTSLSDSLPDRAVETWETRVDTVQSEMRAGIQLNWLHEVIGDGCIACFNGIMFIAV